MNVELFMFLSFAMIIGALFIDVLVGFFKSSFKFAGIFSLSILLYTSFSIDELICSSSNICVRSMKSIFYSYLYLT